MNSSPYSLPPVKPKKAAAADVDTITRQLQAIEADIAAGRLADAANMLNVLGQAYPRDARIYVSGWLLATKADNTSAALQAAERAVALAPNSATAHYCLADSQRRSGDVTAARTSVETALMLMPSNLTYRELAVDLANNQADYAVAERHLRAAFAQNPNIPGIKTMIGNALRLQSNLDEAEKWLTEALARNADDAEAHNGLAMVAYQRDDLATARTHLAEALRLQPGNAGYRHLDAVLSGRPPEQPPEEMTRTLFDRYASRFDSHLVTALKYRVPQILAARILELYPDRKLNILDLGCGTGLLGAALGLIEGFFVGVDLSLPMLEEAKKHSVYARLHHVNLLDALAATDAAEYEVIVAADVFVYMGALDAAISGAFKVLRPGGWLFFSVEAAPEDGPDFTVEKSMRYSHKPQYLKDLLVRNGFTSISTQDLDLRMEQEVAIPGLIVAAQKPA